MLQLVRRAKLADGGLKPTPPKTRRCQVERASAFNATHFSRGSYWQSKWGSQSWLQAGFPAGPAAREAAKVSFARPAWTHWHQWWSGLQPALWRNADASPPTESAESLARKLSGIGLQPALWCKWPISSGELSYWSPPLTGGWAAAGEPLITMPPRSMRT